MPMDLRKANSCNLSRVLILTPRKKAAAAAMAPEPQYFDHHPGRFFYIKDEDLEDTFSVPYRPMCKKMDRFTFEPGIADVRWTGARNGIESELEVVLPEGEDCLEIWKASLSNNDTIQKNIALYVYFPVGFPSWMNTEGGWDDEIEGMLAYALTPYRRLEDYYKNKNLNDFTFLIPSEKPTSWEANLENFEGMGGLRNPQGVQKAKLNGKLANYETTACILQFRWPLTPGESRSIHFLFGPARDKAEINNLKSRYLSQGITMGMKKSWEAFYAQNRPCLELKSPDSSLNHFVNHWLPRQLIYHAYSYRMVTDPQTRNHIQDTMGMNYIDPDRAKALYSMIWSQQQYSGEMPDGLIVKEGAQLKYINQVPHRDHCVWSPFALASYVEETGDRDYLDKTFPFADSDSEASVYDHIARGIEWLIMDRSERGFSYIGQGDWCDPMNMAGHKGKGESIWLTQAMLYAIKTWLPYAEERNDFERVSLWKQISEDIVSKLNTVAWDKDRYARGFTDDGVKFGIDSDEEGKIFLNSQSWGILCGAADDAQIETIIKTVDRLLMTPYGLQVLAPSYTHMREDVGRVTQKHPSTAENGSVYCHANAFYLQALYETGHGETAYPILRSLIPGPDIEDITRREHLPIYIPNYYRGNYHSEQAGKTSHLMNTGSLVWIYRCIVEGLLGLKISGNSMMIAPQIPAEWNDFESRRRFRDKQIDVHYSRDPQRNSIQLCLNGKIIAGNVINFDQLKDENRLEIVIPS